MSNILAEYDAAKDAVATAQHNLEEVRTRILNAVQPPPARNAGNGTQIRSGTTVRGIVNAMDTGTKFTASEVRSLLPENVAHSAYAALQYLVDTKIIRRVSPGRFVKAATKS